MSLMNLQTNLLALNANRNLGISGGKKAKAAEKLSSGYRINNASDDAAGLAISEKMMAQIRGMQQAEKNTEDGINLIKTMDGGMDGIQEIMIRQRELIIQGLNDTSESEDKQKIQEEIDHLQAEINDRAERTNFNNIPLLMPEQYGQQDVVIALDTSGSMGAWLDAARDGIREFADRLPQGSRVSIILYSDKFIGEPDRTLPFTSDPGEMESFLNSNGLLYGDDIPESGFDAIDSAINSLDASSSSNREKHIIFITDADQKTTNFNAAGLNQRMKDRDIIFHGIGPDSGLANQQITELESGTGGSLRSISEDVELPFLSSVDDMSPLWIQCGANSGQGMFIDRYDCRPVSLFKDVFSPAKITVEIGGVPQDVILDKLAVDPTEKGTASLVALDKAFGKINVYRAKAGAQQNRLEHVDNSLAIAYSNLEEAHSRIKDADFAKETMELTKSNILQQSTVSMLAQANAAPQSVLSLLQ